MYPIAEQRFVIFIGGLQSHSLETADDHAIAEDFSAIRNLFAATDPALRFIYFSYRAGPCLQDGRDPRLAWHRNSYEDASEPIYRAIETTDHRVTTHVAGLDWLIRDLLEQYPGARFDLIGFSLGGIVALAWAADASDNAISRINRLVLISCPVGGITPLGRFATKGLIKQKLKQYRIDFGRGLVLDDLRSSSPLINRLPAAIGRTRMASFENSRDYLVNGQRITGQIVLPIWMHTVPLGKGVAVTGFLPDRDCHVADLGGWDRHLRQTHQLILRSSSTAVQQVHGQIVDLVLSSDPLVNRGGQVASANARSESGFQPFAHSTDLNLNPAYLRTRRYTQ